MKEEKMRFEISKDDIEVGYLYIPNQDHLERKIKRQIRLSNLIDHYQGPDVYLDFDFSDTLIGIEIVG